MQAPEVFAGARARRMSRAEYDRMVALQFFDGERVELIHGMVVRMPPVGPPHAEIVDRLAELFYRSLAGLARVRIQQPLLAADESEPEPDVAVVPARSYATAHPDEAMLVVEVAESSLVFDRKTKAPLYAASNVAEYWIVDVGAQSIEAFTHPASGTYQKARRVALGEEIAPLSFPELVVRIDDLFR